MLQKSCAFFVYLKVNQLFLIELYWFPVTDVEVGYDNRQPSHWEHNICKGVAG